MVVEINDWPTWSPIHKKAAGKLGFGAPIHLEEYFEGLGTWETTGFLADWAPLSHIHIAVPKPFYAGSLIRYFEFDALSDNGSTFSVGAMFSGFLSEREGRRYRAPIRAGFETMAEALKTTVEARVAAHPRDPNAPPRSPPVQMPEPKGPSKAPRSRWAGPKLFGHK